MKKNLNTILSTIISLSSFSALAQTPLTSAELYKKLKPGIVVVEVTVEDKVVSKGTGFFVDENGSIFTNTHVIREALTLNHYDIRVRDADGVIYKNPQVTKCINQYKIDACLMKINAKSKHYFTWKSSSPVMEPGQKVYSIGHPAKFEYSISDGIISGIHDIELKQFTGKKFTFTKDGRIGDEVNHKVFYKQIQSTNPISSGNSGSPLFNEKGELLGIVTSVFKGDGTGVTQNLNFSIHRDALKMVFEDKHINQFTTLQETKESFAKDRSFFANTTLKSFLEYAQSLDKNNPSPDKIKLTQFKDKDDSYTATGWFPIYGATCSTNECVYDNNLALLSVHPAKLKNKDFFSHLGKTFGAPAVNDFGKNILTPQEQVELLKKEEMKWKQDIKSPISPFLASSSIKQMCQTITTRLNKKPTPFNFCVNERNNYRTPNEVWRSFILYNEQEQIILMGDVITTKEFLPYYSHLMEFYLRTVRFDTLPFQNMAKTLAQVPEETKNQAQLPRANEITRSSRAPSSIPTVKWERKCEGECLPADIKGFFYKSKNSFMYTALKPKDQKGDFFKVEATASCPTVRGSLSFACLPEAKEHEIIIVSKKDSSRKVVIKWQNTKAEEIEFPAY